MQFGGDVGADNVFDTDSRRFDFSRFEKLSHGAALLFGDCFIFLLDHSEACDGEFQLDFELSLEGSAYI